MFRKFCSICDELGEEGIKLLWEFGHKEEIPLWGMKPVRKFKTLFPRDLNWKEVDRADCDHHPVIWLLKRPEMKPEDFEEICERIFLRAKRRLKKVKKKSQQKLVLAIGKKVIYVDLPKETLDLLSQAGML